MLTSAGAQFAPAGRKKEARAPIGSRRCFDANDMGVLASLCSFERKASLEGDRFDA